MTRSARRWWPRFWQIAAAVSLLSNSSASAQTAKRQGAYAEWRSLSQNEINCVEQSLRAQKSSVWSLIQQGINPSDAAVAAVRAVCQKQAKAPDDSAMGRNGSQALASGGDSAADVAAADVPAVDGA